MVLPARFQLCRRAWAAGCASAASNLKTMLTHLENRFRLAAYAPFGELLMHGQRALVFGVAAIAGGCALAPAAAHITAVAADPAAAETQPPAQAATATPAPASAVPATVQPPIILGWEQAAQVVPAHIGDLLLLRLEPEPQEWRLGFNRAILAAAGTVQPSAASPGGLLFRCIAAGSTEFIATSLDPGPTCSADNKCPPPAPPRQFQTTVEVMP